MFATFRMQKHSTCETSVKLLVSKYAIKQQYHSFYVNPAHMSAVMMMMAEFNPLLLATWWNTNDWGICGGLWPFIRDLLVLS